MIDTIIVITVLFGVLVGVAFLAIRSQGNDTTNNDVVEQDRKVLPIVSARVFERGCEIEGNDALDDDIEEQRDTFIAFSVAQAFDRDCAIIWSTQVPALQLIDNAGKKECLLNNCIPSIRADSDAIRNCTRAPVSAVGSNFSREKDW